MTTVVTVMDREGFDQRTDNIVVVQPGQRRLLWVPRDIWCDVIGDRINVAYKRGGHDTLREGLASLGLPVEHSLCLPRASVERVLDDAVVTVPVEQPIGLWYPLTPTTRVQDGRKPVDFFPPREKLQGERIHHWLGARHGRDPGAGISDLHRIQRQQVFVRALIRQGFDFSAVLHGSPEPSLSDPLALDDLRRVRSWWRFACTDQLVDRTVDGRQVLVLQSPEPRPPRWRRAATRVSTRVTTLVTTSARPGTR